MDRENALGATAANERPAVVFETEADTPEQAADHMIRAIYEEDGYESGSTGEERHDRVDGQQERGGVAQGTSVLETRQQRSAAESVRAAVRAAGVGGTEAVKLGIENTRKGSTVQVVPESVYTDEMRSVAKQNSKDGVKTVFVVGAIELADGSYARGAVSDDGKTVWLRADHASFSVTQINNHEAFHRLAKRDKGLVQQTAERIVSHYGEEDLANMMLAYAEAYHGVDLDTDALLEEILADAYAGMNALGHELYGAGDATRYTEDTVTSAVESHEMRNVLAQENENATQEGGVKYSMERLGAYWYVKADRQILTGNNPKQWARQIEKYINEVIRKNHDIVIPTSDGHALVLTERSAYKLSDRHVSRIAGTVEQIMADNNFALKGRIATHIDEIIQVGRFRQYQNDVAGKHENDIGEDGFNYFDAFFMDVDNKYYRVRFSSAINDAKETVYSIGSVTERKAPTRGGSSSTKGGALNGGRPSIVSIRTTSQKSQEAKTAVQLAFEKAFAKKEVRTENARRDDSKKQKFSRDLQEDMHRENEGLRRQLEAMTGRKDYYKAQSQQTHTFVSPAIIQRMEAEYIKNTSLEAGSIREKLQELGNFMHGPHKNDSFYKDAKDKAAAIAEIIVSNARELTNPDEVTMYRALRKDLRENPVEIAEDIKADFTDWSDWRRRNTAVAMRSGGAPVDVRYDELREQYGEYYFPSDIANPADQLRQIARAVEMMGPKFENPNSYYMAAATEVMANQILRDMVHPTKTDRLIARMKEEAKAGKEAAVTRERQKWERRVGEMVTKQKAQKERQREQRLSSRYREKIRKVANDFRQMILHPTDSRYAPHELMASCLQVALMLDTSGEREDTKAKSRFNEQMRRITEQYDALEKSQDTDYSMEYDKEFAYMVKQLQKRLDGKAIRDLTAAELEDVYLVLHDINEMLKQAKFQIGKAEKITNYTVGESIIRQQQAHGAKVRTRAQQIWDGTMRISANPMRNVRRMTDYDDGAALARLFRELNEGIRKKNSFVMEANKSFDRFSGERMRKSATEPKEYSFDGRKVKMTEMQAMQVILSWEREAVNGTTKHMTMGGILVPDAKLMDQGKGREAVRLGRTVEHIQKEDIDALYESMDDWARDYMDAAREFFNGTAQDAINEATMLLKHRRVATTRNYIPFEIDKDTVAQEIEGVKYDATIEGMGMLKSVQDGAANTLVMRGLNEIIDRHIEKVSQVYQRHNGEGSFLEQKGLVRALLTERC